MLCEVCDGRIGTSICVDQKFGNTITPSLVIGATSRCSSHSGHSHEPSKKLSLTTLSTERFCAGEHSARQLGCCPSVRELCREAYVKMRFMTDKFVLAVGRYLRPGCLVLSLLDPFQRRLSSEDRVELDRDG